MAEVKEAQVPLEVSLLQKIDFFSGLDTAALGSIAELCELQSVPSGQLILKRDRPGDAIYFVMSGRVRLVNDNTPTHPITIDTLGQGACFGERSFLNGTPAEYSAYSVALSTLLKLSKANLDTFLNLHPKIEKRLNEYTREQAILNFLSKSTVFACVPSGKLNKLVSSLSRKELEQGEFLIKEGEEAESLYIVEEGRFNVFKSKDPQNILNIIQHGDVAGEIALLTRNKRTANVVAATRGSVFILPKKEFLALLQDQKELSAYMEDLIEQRTEKVKTGPSDKRSLKVPAGKEKEKKETEDKTKAEPPFKYRAPLKYRLFGRFPAVRQQSVMDCGAACLATVCRYYGKHVSLNSMRELSRVGRAGASMLNILRAANTLGFETSTFLATYEHLMQNHLPAIVNWNGYHWIVIYKVTPTHVTVADPGEGLRKISKEDFLEGWTRYTLYMNPTENISKIEECKPALKQFMPYILPYKKLLFEILLASFIIQILAMFQPLFMKFIIDNVIVKKDDQWLVYSLVAMGFVTAAHLGISFCRQKVLLLVTMKANLLMVTDFYKQVLALPLPFFEDRKVGDITSRFQESEKVTDFLTNTGLQTFLDCFTALMYLGIMFYFNVPMTLVACFFLALHVINVYFITPYLQHSFRDVFQKGAESESFLIESLSGMSTLKTLGVEHVARWTWENLYVRFSNAYFKSIKYGIITSLVSGLVNNMSSIAVLFLGAYMVLQNRLTVGELMAFIMMTGSLTAPIMKIVGVWDTFQEALNAVERLNDVLESKPEMNVSKKNEKISLPSLRGHVQFVNTTFRYEEEGKNVVQNINLEVQPGQRIAFVGRSGSGKSTLIKLLYGFYPLTSGKLYVDGFDISEVWLPSMRSQIGLVSQQSYLFMGSIRENIAKSKPEAPLSEIVEAARLAAAHDFITDFPQGYNTILDEGGRNLSGGQRQRISIARALLQDPRILILDEATSALDNESERIIQQNIDNLFHDRTVFMIAHRLSTVRNADLIVVIDNGNVLEQGTHEQLMTNKKGLYYFLSTQQLNL